MPAGCPTPSPCWVARFRVGGGLSPGHPAAGADHSGHGGLPVRPRRPGGPSAIDVLPAALRHTGRRALVDAARHHHPSGRPVWPPSSTTASDDVRDRAAYRDSAHRHPRRPLAHALAARTRNLRGRILVLAAPVRAHVAAQREGFPGRRTSHRVARPAGPDRRHEPRPAGVAHRLVDRRGDRAHGQSPGQRGADHARSCPSPRQPTGEALGRPRVPRPNPAPAPNPAPVRIHPTTGTTVPGITHPTAADPLRVLILGDSLGIDLGGPLQNDLVNTGVVKATLDARESTGLTRPDYFNWPASCRATSPRPTLRSS